MIRDVAPDYADYLRDESRRVGRAESISFPHAESAVCALLRQMQQERRPVTLQGARTGIAGGAVPDGGHILNLSRMNRIAGLRRDEKGDCFLLRAQPGVVLADLKQALAERQFDVAGWDEASIRAAAEFAAGPHFFFPPDPTETTASLGGMAACNASGACTFGYGSTRRYVESIRVVLMGGAVLALRRGTHRTQGRAFSVRAESGREFQGAVPAYRMPGVKNAAGYFAADDMDLVDLFIGAEGTLGVITEMELRLVRAPEFKWGVMAFLPAESSALSFVRRVRGEGGKGSDSAAAMRPSAIEFFDSHALDLLGERKRTHSAFAAIPEIPEAHHTAIYVEYHGDEEDAVGEAVQRMSELMLACGGNEDATWLATTDREMKPLRDLRHAVPEAVNLTIDERRKTEPGLTKLGTDMAVPDARLEDVIALYHGGLDAAGLDYVMFGHIGNNHVHVNILPRRMADYERGKALYLEWARQVVAMGGTISAEHGVGKLKTALLEVMYGAEGVGQMRAVKRLFDPDWLLNRGDLFPAG